MIAPATDRPETAGPPRFELCACGGTIAAGSSPQSIMAAVRWHNATARHAAWRRRMELEPGWLEGQA
jgi:hypothetical protein